ncbi:MAG: EAL domain-containing protein, partial [Acidaminobacteraceae bacterium]
YLDNFSSIYQVMSPKLSETRNKSSFECVVNSFCGNSIEVLCSTTDLKDSLDEVVGSIWVFQDISGLKESQRDLKRLNFSLEEIVQKRTQSLITTNKSLINQIRERIFAEEKVEQLANFDHLTGIPNLRNFNKKLSLTTQLSILNKTKFAIVFLDIDNFKHVNDTLGHSVGDELLIAVSNRFELTLRSCDYVARNGGDEFIIIIENIEEGHSLNSAIKRINSVFQTPFNLSTSEINITSSIGVSIYPTHSEDTEDLIKFADIAMYNSKNSGKNKVTIFNNELSENISTKVQIINDLKFAIANNQFFLNYQPQINSITDEIVGAEALIRWMHPEKGVISPLDFIKISEENNFIIAIGNWVIDEVFSKINQWTNNGLTIPPISINLSVKQLQSNELVDHIKYCLNKYKINPSLIEFEITETSIMLFEKQATLSIDEISNLGFGIVIDDFGVEYSSLKYIKYLPIKTLKIDKIFIDGINVNLKDEAIIKSIISLSKDLSFNIVAEGVEKNEQIDFLKKLSCNVIQGYIFSKPLSTDDFEEYIYSKRK